MLLTTDPSRCLQTRIMTDTIAKPPRTRRPKAPPAPPPGDETPVDAAETVDMGLLGESIGFLLKRVQMAVFTDFIRTFSPADIRPAQFSVLIIIARNPGLKQSQVSAALSIKRTNFVPLLDSLEARGLVKRKLAATDRRSHALHLTAKGTALVGELTALWHEHEGRIRTLLGGDDAHAHLCGLLNRLTDMGGPVDDDADTDAPPPPKPRRRKPD